VEIQEMAYYLWQPDALFAFIAMPSRRQNQTKMTVAEERKKRQEKFRKRTGSLFDKVKKLALDTDAFVALVIRDRAGRVRSFRSSDSLYWPHSITDLIVSGETSRYT